MGGQLQLKRVECRGKHSGVTMEGGGEESKKADPSNPRGIPPQEFIENVGEYCKAFGTNESVISTQQEMYSKYKFMEAQMAQHRNAIAGKKPEIEKSLAMLKKLIEKREKGEDSMKTHFQLANSVYTQAEVPVNEDSRVGLWLGANVMLEYTYDEALELLTKNLEQATASVKQLDVELDFIKDQITTTEVNIARVYNHDVRAKREAAGKK